MTWIELGIVLLLFVLYALFAIVLIKKKRKPRMVTVNRRYTFTGKNEEIDLPDQTVEFGNTRDFDDVDFDVIPKCENQGMTKCWNRTEFGSLSKTNDEVIIIKEDKMLKRTKKSRNLDRARISLTQKHEVDYLKRAARQLLERTAGMRGTQKVEVRVSVIRRQCKAVLKLLKKR